MSQNVVNISSGSGIGSDENNFVSNVNDNEICQFEDEIQCNVENFNAISNHDGTEFVIERQYITKFQKNGKEYVPQFEKDLLNIQYSEVSEEWLSNLPDLEITPEVLKKYGTINFFTLKPPPFRFNDSQTKRVYQVLTHQ